MVRIYLQGGDFTTVKEIVSFILGLLWILLLASCADKRVAAILEEIGEREEILMSRNLPLAQFQQETEKIVQLYEQAIQLQPKKWKHYLNKCNLYKWVYFWYIGPQELSEQDIFIAMEKVVTEYVHKYGWKGPAAMSYAMVNHALGRYDKGEPVYQSIYNPQHKYNMIDPSIADVRNFVAGYFLGKISLDTFEGTMYEYFIEEIEEGTFFMNSIATDL